MRNRTVVVPGSVGSPMEPLDVSAEEDQLIMEETAPQEMIEEQTQALSEEIKKLQVY